jgi:hypothetical protein
MNKSTTLFTFSFLSILLFASCAKIYYYSESAVNAHRNKYYISVTSFGNYNLNGKTFYIESGDNNISSYDVEFKEYADYIEKSLISAGAIKYYDKKKADMCIILTYGISDESYIESVPIPIWGQTGISSISSTSNTTGSAYGSATRIGNSVYGSIQGNTTTNTTTIVNPSYGITGYRNVNRKVTVYRRFLNVYAYDNTNKNETIMLWKTNIISDGYSSDLRKVIPVMSYAAISYFGNSSGETKNHYIFEDNEDFINWKEGTLPNPNVVEYPKFMSTNVDPEMIVIKKIIKTNNETIIDFVAYNTGTYGWFRISPNTYIECEQKKYKIMSAVNIVLGEKNDITKYSSWEFRLIFPSIPSNVNFININEGIHPGFFWNGVYVKRW